MNKQASKDNSHKGSGTPTSPVSVSGSDGGGGNFSSYADYTSRDVSEDIEDEDPPLSERVAIQQDDVRVKFEFQISSVCNLWLLVLKRRNVRRRFYSTRRRLSGCAKKPKMIDDVDESK